MSELKAALIYQDHCVIQRQKPIHIWGTCRPGHRILVLLGDETGGCCGDFLGNWEVWLPPREAEFHINLEIQDQDSGETLRYTGLAVGEVWIAGGQSNMEFLMKFDDDRYLELSRPEQDTIRYFEVPRLAFEEDTMDTSSSGRWRLCRKEQLEDFSAVGYYFARDLGEALHIPVGIVACNWGGTTALTWMPKERIQGDPLLKKYWQSYEKEIESLNLDRYQKEFYQSREKSNRLNKTAHHQIQHWISREDQLDFVREQSLEKYGLVPPLPMGPWNQNSPGRLWESMVLKIGGMGVRGVLWYQGESDIARGEDYHLLLSAVIQSWRGLWKEELPWLFVQLAPFYKWLDQDGTRFPLIRQKQEYVSQTVPGTWMVSTTDCGLKWGIHPTRKKPIGKRLCLLARGKVYGEDILCESPRCIGARLTGNQLCLTFDHSGDGMELHDEIQSDLYISGDGWKAQVKKMHCQGNQLVLDLSEYDNQGHSPITMVEFMNLPYGESVLYNSAGLPPFPFVLPVIVSV